ncbi:MAG TPA: SLC13 family permease, partial [Hyphomicrobiaceae bacterium]|nr:SLC13 family permease [Hyphomicrobiaceae bacterium]
MTMDQALAFAIVGGMMALFAWGRVRYDVVAMIALFAAVLVGIVPAKSAFSGFGDDVVIIVAMALIVSAAVARSGIAETLLRPVSPYLSSTQAQVFALGLAVIVLSTFIKNVGALAILMPVAFQMARRTGTSASQLLMPLSFGSLIGGLITLVGTSPNIIVARVREEIVGQPFAMFDYAPVGLGIAAAGLICLVLTYRLLPQDRKAGAGVEKAINIEDYVTELRVPESSPLIGTKASEVAKLGEGNATVTMVVGEKHRRFRPTPALLLQEGDVLLIEGDPETLERIVVRGGLELVGEKREHVGEPDGDEVGVIECVVEGNSMLTGSTIAELRLRERYPVNVLAISRRGERITQRLSAVRIQSGDVIVLQGPVEAFPDILQDMGLLPLAERDVRLGTTRYRWAPIAVLAFAMVAVVFEWVPVSIAFFGAATVLMATRLLPLREAYSAVEWPIIVLLGALIPVSEAVRTTGGTDLIASWLSMATNALPPVGSLALIMIAAMAVTPFLNNAATVLVMAPIAASLAGKMSISPDPFLMAVAVGAACDFLTPFGHQCNTLVLGPGGYRFGDYFKLGLPLSVVVVVVGVPL